MRSAATAARREFDFVIVGAGSAGRVIATHSSTDAGNLVLLLKAGGKEVQTDEALDDFIRQHANTLFHPTGSCRMGADAASVQLRVIDDSVMPRVPQYSTNLPTIRSPEKGVDMILQGRAA